MQHVCCFHTFLYLFVCMLYDIPKLFPEKILENSCRILSAKHFFSHFIIYHERTE